MSDAPNADSVWPVGPPHEFAPAADERPDAICTACNARRDRAIHSHWYWSQQGVSLVGATDFVLWRDARIDGSGATDA